MLTTRVSTPGGAKTWLDVLPDEFARDPHVVVVSAPHTSHMSWRETLDGKHKLGVLEINGRFRGLQVIEPKPALWLEHQEIFRSYGIEIMDPDYVGPLSTVPESLTHRTEFTPLLFFRDAMWRPHLNLKRYAFSLTKERSSYVN